MYKIASHESHIIGNRIENDFIRDPRAWKMSVFNDVVARMSSSGTVLLWQTVI